MPKTTDAIPFDKRFTHLFPPPSQEDRERLKTDILESGEIRDPVLVWKGKLVDGRSRYEIGRELKMEIPYRDLAESLTEMEVLQLVRSKNVARRNLSTGQLAAIAAEMGMLIDQFIAKKSPGAEPVYDADGKPKRSVEIVAEMMGTNKQYVHDAEQIKQQSPELLEKVKNGEITIPAAKRMLSQAVANDEPTTEDGKPVTTDSVGLEVPAKLLDVFAQVPAFDEAVKLLKEVRNLVQQLAQGPASTFLDWDEFHAHVNEAIKAVRAGKPYAATCPNCTTGCATCHRKRWLNRTVYQLAVAEQAAAGNK